jgi:hypothetical protein
MRRRAFVVGTTVFVLAAGGGVVAVTQPFTAKAAPAVAPDPARLAAIKEGPLSSQVTENGTLAYAGQEDGTPYTAVNQIDGIYTSVPTAGQEVKCGDVVYIAGDTPVPLLCGDRPAYRDLAYGDEGWDVQALNRNLADLGYGTSRDSDEFGYRTKKALKELQEKIGAEETGVLKLGEAVFLPGPLRVSKVLAKLGTRAGPGAAVAEATSSSRQVTVSLSASQQSDVKVGDPVQITLPSNKTTPGKVSRIGTVVTAPEGKDATVPITVSLDRPADAGALDQAPVRVEITTDGVPKALIVPVTALLGQAGGGYAVEKVDATGKHALVPVTLGLFDHTQGLVQVTGPLAAGDRVVVPAT